MKRRTFLQLSALAAGSVALTRPENAGAQTGSRDTFAAGLQLYTIRDRLQADYAGTLARVAEIGYREVETYFNFFGNTPMQVRRMLDASGLRAPSGHYSVPGLRDRLEEIIDVARTLGHEHVVCAHPNPLPHATLDDYRALADLLNRFGSRVRAAGLRFAYHNHGFDLALVEGQAPMVLLLDRVDPTYVEAQLDLYWAVHAGYDPIAFLDRYRGRVSAVHIKDLGPNREMVDVGDGVIDFSRILAHAFSTGVRHAFVEHGTATDTVESAERSYRYLHRKGLFT